MVTFSRVIVGSQKGSGRVVLVVVGPSVEGAAVIGAAVVGAAVVGAAVVGAAVVEVGAVVGAAVVGAAVVGAAVVGAAVVGAAVVGAAVVGDAVVGAAVVVPGSMVVLKHCRAMAPEPPSVATIVFTPHTSRETKSNSLLPVAEKFCWASRVSFSSNASTLPFSSVSTKRKSSTQLGSLNVMVIVPPSALSSTLAGVPPASLVQPSPSQQLAPQRLPQISCFGHGLAS